MTDNRTTELLLKLLEERGLSYQTHYLHASWRVGQKLYGAVDNLDGTLTVDNLTPEQAIAATLGSEREKELEELVRDAYWLIVRAVWTHVSQDKFAADWTERVSVLGIEVD